MAELILTEQEKKDASYLDWGDEALGKLVKMIAALINDEYGKDAAWHAMAAHLLVDLSRKTNSTDTTLTVRGCTKDGEEIGDWAVNIKRLDT
jgi:hypothetical protein